MAAVEAKLDRRLARERRDNRLSEVAEQAAHRQPGQDPRLGVPVEPALPIQLAAASDKRAEDHS